MYCDCDLDQERIEQSDAAYQERYLEGCTDAAFARLPESADEAYLAGYCAKLKELPTDTNGRLIHHQTTQLFAWGYVDNPEPTRNEF